MESKQTAKLHTVLSRKSNDNLIIEEETSESGLGFVNKFVSIATFRNKLESVLSDIKSRKWSSAYPHVWGTNYITEPSTFRTLSSKLCFYQSWKNLLRKIGKEAVYISSKHLRLKLML